MTVPDAPGTPALYGQTLWPEVMLAWNSQAFLSISATTACKLGVVMTAHHPRSAWRSGRAREGGEKETDRQTEQETEQEDSVEWIRHID